MAWKAVDKAPYLAAAAAEAAAAAAATAAEGGAGGSPARPAAPSTEPPSMDSLGKTAPVPYSVAVDRIRLAKDEEQLFR